MDTYISFENVCKADNCVLVCDGCGKAYGTVWDVAENQITPMKLCLMCIYRKYGKDACEEAKNYEICKPTINPFVANNCHLSLDIFDKHSHIFFWDVLSKYRSEIFAPTKWNNWDTATDIQFLSMVRNRKWDLSDKQIKKFDVMTRTYIDPWLLSKIKLWGVI